MENTKETKGAPKKVLADALDKIFSLKQYVINASDMLSIISNQETQELLLKTIEDLTNVIKNDVSGIEKIVGKDTYKLIISPKLNETVKYAQGILEKFGREYYS